MPKVSMKELLESAESENYAIGSFSVINMETVIGTIKAAEETNSPIILQIAEPRFKYAPFSLMGPLMVKAAEMSSAPIAVHLDHGKTMDAVREAISYGFTSVMLDASHADFETNFKMTQAAAKLAHLHGVDCEGEIGKMGKDEDGAILSGVALTSVSQAVEFVGTGIDACAVAIGNQHGLQDVPPVLNFTRLAEIKKSVSLPLVLHGGSGITEQEFKECIRCGIRKINIATQTLQSILDNTCEYLLSGGNDYFVFHEKLIEGAYSNVVRHIEMFGSKSKA